MSLYDFELKTMDGATQSLSAYDGKVAVIVNVASECGLTPHYEGLQSLYEKYSGQGLEVLGVPCNQFGGQEPGTEEEIRAFCTSRFGVTFPMYAKVEVNGDGRAPLYAWLTAASAAPDSAGDIGWNFAKFVIGRDGAVHARFAPTTAPDDPAFVDAIEAALSTE